MSMALVASWALWVASTLMWVVMTLAWKMFGRPAHARTWSIMFAIGMIEWSFLGLILLSGADVRFPRVISSLLLFATTSLAVIGHRQRVGLPPCWREFGLASAAALIPCALAAIYAPDGGLPYFFPYIFGAGLLLLGVRAIRSTTATLNPAEVFAIVALLLFAMLQIAMGVIGVFGARELYQWGIALGLPSAYMALGLSGAFLIAADLGAQLQGLVVRDPLTGALNRRGLDAAAAQVIAQAVRHQRPLTLVIVDIDHFKAVNDGHGHPFGDRVLGRFADCLRGAVREDDLFARLGGDEFCLLLNEASEEQAAIAVERARGCIAQLDATIRITASFGISGLRVGDTLHSMIERADTALYEAKVGGRDRAALAPGGRLKIAG